MSMDKELRVLVVVFESSKLKACNRGCRTKYSEVKPDHHQELQIHDLNKAVASQGSLYSGDL